MMPLPPGYPPVLMTAVLAAFTMFKYQTFVISLIRDSPSYDLAVMRLRQGYKFYWEVSEAVPVHCTLCNRPGIIHCTIL